MANHTKHWRKWFQRGFVSSVLVLITLGLIGFIYQAVAIESDRMRFVANGDIVSVDGYDMHLHCIGQGSPTVLLEAGLGLPSLAWGVIQPVIAEHTRVCAYDRAGLGWSESRPEARTAQQLASELNTLLTNAGVDDDLIFVSHSFGGLITRLYADQFADRIAGIVMVDALLGEEYSPACKVSCFSEDMLNTISTINSGIASLSQFGVVRLMLPSIPLPLFEVVQTLPDELRPAVSAAFATSQHWQTNNAEFASIGISAEQALAANDFDTIPLIVITAASTYDGQAVPGMTAAAVKAMWMQAQKLLAGLSTHSSQVVIADATHNSLLTQPEHAQFVVEAVFDLLGT